MPFVAVPNVVMVELRAQLDGQKIENRFNVRTPGAPNPTSVGAIATIVESWAVASYFPHLPDAVSLTEVVASDISVVGGVQITNVPATAVTGGAGSGALPNEVSFAVSLRTGLRGRSFRGRAYVLALLGSFVVANRVNPVAIGQFTGAFNTLIGDLAAGGFELVIVSLRANNLPRPTPISTQVTVAVSTDDIVDSMRRRKPGVGS